MDEDERKVRLHGLAMAINVAIALPLAMFSVLTLAAFTNVKLPYVFYALLWISVLGFFSILASGYPTVTLLIDRSLKYLEKNHDTTKPSSNLDGSPSDRK